MQNLKINGVPTSYWCVVVDVDARLSITPYALLYKSGVYPAVRSVLPFPNMELLGCITLYSMDEGVREVDNLLAEHWVGICSHWKVNIMKFLTHNQITLTADTKAVVVKQK